MDNGRTSLTLAFTIIILLLGGSHSSTVGGRPLERKLLSALECALDALGSRMSQVYLDVALGLRFADDQLESLLQDLSQAERIGGPDALQHLAYQVEPRYQEIQAVQQKAQFYADTAASQLFEEEQSRRPIMHLLDDGLWRGVSQKRDVTAGVVMDETTGQELTESLSDLCFDQILSGDQCEFVNDTCWNVMTSLGQKRYGLTHQVLYLTVGLALNCSLKLGAMANHNGQPHPIAFLESFCERVYLEARTTANRGYPMRLRDLFLEQVAVCGSLNYPGFNDVSWMKAAMSWQRPDGCFTSMSPTASAEIPVASSREKRETRFAKDGCHLHMTSVGAGALAVFFKLRIRGWRQ